MFAQCMYFIWIILSCIAGISRPVFGDNFYDLQKTLFAEYDSGVRPHCEPDYVTRVKIDVALRQILFMNEPTQEIKIKVWMRLYWDDCRLTWNETEFGTNSLYLPYDRVWTPDISLFDSTSDDALPGIEDYRVKILNDGSMQYQWPTVITSYCKLNVRDFPFDSQVCEIIFSSWIYNGGEIDLSSVRFDGYADMNNYQENAEWAVEKYESKRTVTYYNCCKQPFTDMRYILHIKRRYLNYIVTLVFPCLLISFLPIFGFLLPVNYGEKISLQVTMMLSLAVFLMVISSSLPPSAESLPLLGIYFVCSLSLVAISCVVTIGVINIHFQSRKYVSPWVRKYIIEKMGYFCCVDSDLQTEENITEEPHSALANTNGYDIYYTLKSAPLDNGGKCNKTQNQTIPSNIQMVEKLLHRIEKRIVANERERKRAKEWHILAKIADRFFFCLCFIFLSAMLLVIFPHP